MGTALITSLPSKLNTIYFLLPFLSSSSSSSSSPPPPPPPPFFFFFFFFFFFLFFFFFFLSVLLFVWRSAWNTAQFLSMAYRRHSHSLLAQERFSPTVLTLDGITAAFLFSLEKIAGESQSATAILPHLHRFYLKSSKKIFFLPGTESDGSASAWLVPKRVFSRRVSLVNELPNFTTE